MSCSSAKYSSRWYTTTGCSGGGCPITHFTRTISADYRCRRPAASASLAAPPTEETMMFGSASPEWAAPPEFDVTSSDDPRTDLEDELLQISPLPTIMSLLPELFWCLHPCIQRHRFLLSLTLHQRLIHVLSHSGWWTNARQFTYFLHIRYHRHSLTTYDPTTSPVTSDVPGASECLSPGSPAAMDWYLAEDGDLLLGYSSGLPLLPLPLLPLPADDVPSPESAATHSTGGQFPASTAMSPDLSREGPFDASQTVSASGAAPHLLDN